ncbi:MAG: hypothetical protein ACREVA_02250 [Burkholderiales bacterium]
MAVLNLVCGADDLDNKTGSVFLVAAQGPATASAVGISIGYNFTQSVASTTWTIAHNLGYYPAVMTFTLGGIAITAFIQHISLNVTIITFNTSTAGFAHLV